jgi:flagellar motor protein MotB
MEVAMRSQLAAISLLAILHTFPAYSQPVPIYKVTVIERAVKAVNYQYRGGQTRIDFAGTVLLPVAKGEAIVECKAGRTEIDAKFSRVTTPTRFGREYLTYVLWAITPEGHAKNLGEVLAGAGDHAHLTVTTDLQAFGMIVTAEPYSAVRQPSDVVVMENVVRPDTIGKSEPIQARFELLPRGAYTYVRSGVSPAAEGPKVSIDRYESLVAVYQAQNAVQIARSQGAEKFAPDTLAKAESLLAEARQMEERRMGRNAVVTEARQAAQTAEDARAIAAKHLQDDELAKALAVAAEERAKRQEAERAARDARIQADQERARADAAAAANTAQETVPQGMPAPAPPSPRMEPAPPPSQQDLGKTAARMQLLRRMNSFFPTTDTPRGLVIMLHDRDFRGPALDPAIAARVANLASVIAGQHGLNIEVEGHGEESSAARAVEVGDTLVRGGLPTDVVMARGLGTSRPLVAAGSPSAREQNRRVEIIISGEPIGTLATWDRRYSLRQD